MAVSPPATLILEKVRSVDDPRIYDLRDSFTGDRGVPPSCELPGGTTVRLTSRKDATLEIDRQGKKRTIDIENVAGLARATLACGDKDDFYYANPRLGTLYATAPTGCSAARIPWCGPQRQPFTNQTRPTASRPTLDCDGRASARATGALEWFFSKRRGTGSARVFDGATVSLGKLDRPIPGEDERARPPGILPAGGGNETANYVPEHLPH